MHTRLLEVPNCLLPIPRGLNSQQFLIGLGLLLQQAVELDICGWVLVHVLVDQGHNTLQDVCHTCFCSPVFRFDQGQADVTSLVDMHVTELWLEFDEGTDSRVLQGEGNGDWVVAALPEGVFPAWHPQNPEVVPLDALWRAFDYLCPLYLTDLLQLVIDSSLPHYYEY